MGLMKAVRRFNPEFGVRLVSFAVHWIKAEMHEFILKNWRIVKIATTKPQRKLFFNLRRAKKRLGWMNDTEVRDVAEQLGVTPEDVRKMETRLSGYDEAFELEPDQEDGLAPSHYLTDEMLDPYVITEKDCDSSTQSMKLFKGFDNLDVRSREIIQRRWVTDGKATLQELADQFGVSAERIRQLEKNALKKLKLSLKS